MPDRAAWQGRCKHRWTRAGFAEGAPPPYIPQRREGECPPGPAVGAAVGGLGVPLFPPGPHEHPHWARLLRLWPELAPARSTDEATAKPKFHGVAEGAANLSGSHILSASLRQCALCSALT